MAEPFDPLRAEIEKARASLAPTAKARTERGKAIRKAVGSRRVKAAGRNAVFSVRCRDDMPDAIKKHAESLGLKIAEWFEQLIDRELGTRRP